MKDEKSELLRTFSARVQERLRAMGLTQKALGALIGMSPTSAGAYCRGDAMPSILQAWRIAQALDTSVDFLVGLSDGVPDGVWRK